MSRIRKLYYFDKKNAEEMISFLNNSANDNYINHIMFNPFVLLHHMLPLKFKFLPESYVLKDRKVLKGLITVAPSRSPLSRMEIQKLLFEENCYEDAEELIQYVVSKYKAMGTASFVVRVDDYMPELIKLFISKCGFSQISYEKLWRINHIEKKDYALKGYRTFRNSDASVVTSLYNESLLPHFRPLLGKGKKEFRDVLCKGLSYYSEYKYVIEDTHSRNVVAYISIKSSDNENFVLDLIQSGWANVDIDEVIAFVNYQIHKRRKKFNLYIKTKKYTQLGEQQEQDFIKRKYECLQNQVVLTNSSARIIKNTEHSGKYMAINQIFSGVQAIN